MDPIELKGLHWTCFTQNLTRKTKDPPSPAREPRVRPVGLGLVWRTVPPHKSSKQDHTSSLLRVGPMHSFGLVAKTGAKTEGREGG